jgi:DNA invertase Pin-like site-specific DNA recombinase
MATRRNPKLTVIGYARISDDDTYDGKGVQRQRQDIEAYCCRQGWTLAEVVIDNDRGASDYSKKARPEYERVLATLRSGAVDGVVAYSIERLTRRWDQGHDLMQLGESGVHVVGVVQSIDLATEGGREMYGYMLTQARNESATIRRRVKRAQEQARQEGRKHQGSRRLFGYEYSMEIRPSEAKVAVEMVRRAAAGESASAIARCVNEQAATTTTGMPWASRTVKSFVLNPAIAGLASYYGKVIGQGQWKGLVGRAQWERACNALEVWALAPGSRVPVSGKPSLFSGWIVCDECGAKMTRAQAMSGNGPSAALYATWKCERSKGGCGHNSITADCERYIEAWLFAPGGPLHDTTTALPPDQAPDVRSEEDVQTDVRRLFRLRDLMSDDDFEAEALKLEAELAESKRQTLGVSPVDQIIISGTAEQMWALIPVEQKRQILARLGVPPIRIAKISRRAWNDEIAAKRLILSS